jgi:hypothetical protein
MMEKTQPLQQMLLGKLDIHMQKTENRSLFFTLYQNQIKDLIIRSETLKQLQEAVRNTLQQIGIGKNFLNRTQKAQSAAKRNNEQNGLNQTKELLHSKGNSHHTQRQPTE